LNTWVGKYIVSTVGELIMPKSIRESGEKPKYHDIGLDRKYETMVFKSKKQDDGSKCCPYCANFDKQVDFRGYNDPEDARLGHMELCIKWGNKKS